MKKCILSWKKYFPDYKIIEWNESNFDINICSYVKEAYEEQKWAFVSDYARFWIIYNYGGLYFDTDVEVIQSFDKIINKGSFMGCEYLLTPGSTVGINPGIGMGAEPGLPIYQEILNFYNQKHFRKTNGELDKNTIVDITSEIFAKYGWNAENIEQIICGISIYPTEYFCPMNYVTGKTVITDNTFSIHHYNASWHNKTEAHIEMISHFFVNNFGIVLGRRIARFVDFPLRIKNKISNIGVLETTKLVYNKIHNFILNCIRK